MRLFRSFHIWLIRVSKGKLGSRFGSQHILLLHTTGRKSGKDHVTPVGYVSRDGEYYVIASNWGRQNHAAWYYNLRSKPGAVIEVGGREIPVEASEVTDGEYETLWQAAEQQYSGYAKYRQMTDRHIPIFRLKPIAG